MSPTMTLKVDIWQVKAQNEMFSLIRVRVWERVFIDKVGQFVWGEINGVCELHVLVTTLGMRARPLTRARLLPRPRRAAPSTASPSPG